jgi:hypothetical protein
MYCMQFYLVVETLIEEQKNKMKKQKIPRCLTISKCNKKHHKKSQNLIHKNRIAHFPVLVRAP